MDNLQNHFDKSANNWDNNLDRLERAKKIADIIKNSIDLSKISNALEFGAGTGTLSILLQPYIKNITLIDESKEMLNVAQNKITNNKINNISIKQINLLEQKYSSKYDLIYTLMTLHHILDTKKIIQIFHSLLNDNGYLVIADLLSEDGSFHENFPTFNGHNGFDSNLLKELLTQIGFKIIKYDECLKIRKNTKKGEKEYIVFILIAQK